MMLLDTNIVILYIKGDAAVTVWIDRQRERKQTFALSSLSVVELLGYPDILPQEAFLIERWLKTFLMIDLDLSVSREAAKIRRTYRMTTSDSIIAATARLLDIPLVTKDRDFKKIKSITVLVP